MVYNGNTTITENHAMFFHTIVIIISMTSLITYQTNSKSDTEISSIKVHTRQQTGKGTIKTDAASQRPQTQTNIMASEKGVVLKCNITFCRWSAAIFMTAGSPLLCSFMTVLLMSGVQM